MNTKSPSCADEPPGAVVATVATGSASAAAGVRPGDRVRAVNGGALRDVIDFQFHAAEDALELELERDGTILTVGLERGAAADLGLTFEAPRPKEIATCANACVFCFIHQLPKGMRKSLYVKDDDYRLSFLHGNYITLTDLGEADLQRIEAQRLSPLYVSVHATDPALRQSLLGRPRVTRPILPLMERLARAGIRMHAQIVLCPDLNDGQHLEQTVFDLARLHPGVATTAIVPVGLTRHRERLPHLRPITVDEARRLIDIVHGWQGELRARLGRRFVFLGDEVYLLAGVEVPGAAAYEGFSILEDGVGLVRRFEDGFRRLGAKRARRLTARRRITVVTGTMYAPRLQRLFDGAPVENLTVDVAAVANDVFGRGITVAGLLTGRDIERDLARRALGDAVLVPAVAIRETDGVFLDDMTPADLARHLEVPVRVVEPNPRALLLALTR